MARLLRFACPIDGLAVDVHLPFALLDGGDDLADHLATQPVGYQINYQTDDTAVCPNGHHFAINFKVELTREA